MISRNRGEGAMTSRTVVRGLAGAVAALLVVGAAAVATDGFLAAGQAPPLSLRPGEATIWYLGHCGFAVRTAKHLLIFDYQERRDGPQLRTRGGTTGLDTGWVDPAAIARDRVRVFVSHSHEDHFDPVVFSWRKTVPDIAYYFGWQAADDSANHYLVGPRAAYTGDGLETFTINSHHSGVPEVAFLVKVDGLAIYHNGDYRMDYQADFPYLQKHAARFDLAFVLGVSDEGIQYGQQNRDLFERFKPGAVFPMHAEAGARMYREFVAAFGARIPGLPIMVPEQLGDRFEYRGGRISRTGSSAE
jgi:L-ascorbate metabolism protein UlaG (beta-lactamase superfamily)